MAWCPRRCGSGVASALGCTGTAGIPGSPRTSLGDQRTGHRHDPGSEATGKGVQSRACGSQMCPGWPASARSGRPHRRSASPTPARNAASPDVQNGWKSLPLAAIARAWVTGSANLRHGRHIDPLPAPRRPAASGSQSRRQCRSGRAAPSSSAAARTSGRSASPPSADHAVGRLAVKHQVSDSAQRFGHPQAPGGIDGSLSRGWCRHRRCFPLHPPRSRTWPSPARRDDLRTGRHPQTGETRGPPTAPRTRRQRIPNV